MKLKNQYKIYNDFQKKRELKFIHPKHKDKVFIREYMGIRAHGNALLKLNQEGAHNGASFVWILMKSELYGVPYLVIDDYAWIMKAISEGVSEEFGEFRSPQSFLDYLDEMGIGGLPDRTTLSRAEFKTGVGQHPEVQHCAEGVGRLYHKNRPSSIGPSGSLQPHATGSPQCRQDRRCNRYDDLNNKLSRLFLRHN